MTRGDPCLPTPIWRGGRGLAYPVRVCRVRVTMTAIMKIRAFAPVVRLACAAAIAVAASAAGVEAATLVGYFPDNDPFGGEEKGLYGTFGNREISSPSLAKCDVGALRAAWENGAVEGEDYTERVQHRLRRRQVRHLELRGKSVAHASSRLHGREGRAELGALCARRGAVGRLVDRGPDDPERQEPGRGLAHRVLQQRGAGAAAGAPAGCAAGLRQNSAAARPLHAGRSAAGPHARRPGATSASRSRRASMSPSIPPSMARRDASSAPSSISGIAARVVLRGLRAAARR